MHRLVSLGTVFLATAVLFASENTKSENPKPPTEVRTADEKFDPAKLEGKWEYTKGWVAGTATSADKLKHSATIDKDTFTLEADKTGEKFVITYKITDKSKDIAPIDMEIKSGPGGAKGKAIGIVWCDGKEMKLAYVVDDGKAKRPTDFKSTTDNKVHSFELKKK
jgi:uncharacterized protein (TIGR03067 family)